MEVSYGQEAITKQDVVIGLVEPRKYGKKMTTTNKCIKVYQCFGQADDHILTGGYQPQVIFWANIGGWANSCFKPEHHPEKYREISRSLALHPLGTWYENMKHIFINNI